MISHLVRALSENLYVLSLISHLISLLLNWLGRSATNLGNALVFRSAELQCKTLGWFAIKQVALVKHLGAMHCEMQNSEVDCNDALHCWCKCTAGGEQSCPPGHKSSQLGHHVSRKPLSLNHHHHQQRHRHRHRLSWVTLSHANHSLIRGAINYGQI